MLWAEALKLPLRSLLRELRLDWLLDKEDLQHGRRRDVCGDNVKDSHQADGVS